MNAAVADDVRIGYSINPWMTPYHEAGHTLVLHRCGRTISSVTVSSHGGQVRSSGDDCPEIGLLVAIAGNLAERRAPSCMPELIGFASRQDQQLAEQCLDLIAAGPMEREWILGDARRQVDEVLADEQDLLHQIAKQLLARGRLDGYQLRQWLT